MKALIKRIFSKCIVYKNVLIFTLRQKIGGFDYATRMFLLIDKKSALKILKKFGATLGDNIDIETPLIFHNCKDFSNLIIGNNCHIGKDCFFDLREQIIIENSVVVSMCTKFITHIDMSNSILSVLYPATSSPIIVRNNSYIGANSTILKGVSLQEGSFIAAGSVVINDVGSYTLVGGVPAKFLKKINTPG